MRATAAARVSVTVLPATSTGLVSARSTALPPTVTTKSAAAGTELSSRPPSKVTVSVAPFTAALWYAGGVLLVTVCRAKTGAALPLRSRTRGCPAKGLYSTLTAWPWVTGVARVAVTVRPTTRCTLPNLNCRWRPSTWMEKEPGAGGSVSSSASLKVTTSASPFTAALSNAGPVVSSGV